MRFPNSIIKLPLRPLIGFELYDVKRLILYRNLNNNYIGLMNG